MRGAVFALVGLLGHLAAGQPTCTVNNVLGVCIDNQQCTGTATPGFCAGAANIQCCTDPVCSVPGVGTGTCRQTTSCAGSAHSGYCAGPANLQCCVSGGGGGCTVASSIAAGGCSTAVVGGLSDQIINQMGTGNLVNFNGSHVSLGSAVQPYLNPSAANALLASTAQMNDFMSINSAYRTPVQQFMLYEWYLRGQCGIPAAARPGGSNHESGLALDTSSYTYWRPALEANGWRWYGAGDVFHFDYVGQGSVDLRSAGVRAFQELYNARAGGNLSADGVYGPATEAAMNASPCNGW